MIWTNALAKDINISVLTKILPSKGRLVYEYNPFRNYRLTLDMYEYKDRLYTAELLKDKFGIEWDGLLESEENNSAESDNPGYWVKDGSPIKPLPTTYLKGELVDFVTDELSFDLSHPVNIIPQYSYDGSVNLIFNDGKNLPRLINSRFSATGKNTYEIVDRRGNNDTNIYNQGSLFDTDTSLYKRVKQIPKLTLESVQSGGALKCGNYHFYFKLADADGNETDFVAESGLVSIFVGNSYPLSIYTGNRDENAVKLVVFHMKNIDPSYNYVHVYYSRALAEDGENRLILYKKIEREFIVNNIHEARILINGFDEESDVTAQDINLSYNVVDAANCTATAQGMLFLGNVHKPNIPHDELSDLSLRFLPYLLEEDYKINIDKDYNIQSLEKGYYSPKFIYDNVGYWGQELYRLGIVYILSNGELSPVFNIRGREKIKAFKHDRRDEDNNELTAYDSLYSHFEFENDNGKVTVQYNESDYLVVPPSEGAAENAVYENIKGVISLDPNEECLKIYAIEVRVEEETIERLKALGIKGYFFVRQSRMPLTLAQGITIGIDKEGRVPTIPTKNGILTKIAPSLAKTYVETGAINFHNYVSEGFLSRYSYELKAKSSFWGKIAKYVMPVAAVAAVAVGLTTGVGGAILTKLALGSIGIGTGTMLTIGGITTTVAAMTGVIDNNNQHNSRSDEGTTTENITLQLSITPETNPVPLKGRHDNYGIGWKKKESDDSRLLGASFKDRLIIKDYTKNAVEGILCPDYDVAPLYYNLLFTGQDFVVKPCISQSDNEFNEIWNGTTQQGYYFENDDRHFYMGSYKNVKSNTSYISKIQAVPDNVQCVTIGKTKFRSKAGEAHEAWRYECIGDDYKQTPSSHSEDDNLEQTPTNETLTDSQIKKEIEDKLINTDIVRGSYGPYLGMVGYNGKVGETVSIMIPGYNENNMEEYFQIRMQDVSPFYAISDRYDINDLYENQIMYSRILNDINNDKNCKFVLHRGDCYICQFTHRLNRNFNDPSSPYNSDVVDSKSWKRHYKIEKSEEFEKINVGDVNAINLGMWVTFTVRSTRNLNIRSLDGSVIEETTKMGHPRGFFPYYGMIADGSYKSPEALVYNDGFTTNLSERFNFTLPDTPYIRNWYGTRIMYSDIHINDAYKNGYRVFHGLNYRDYTRQYGSIVKLLNYSENLFVVFEHGLAIIPINERAVAAEGSGGLAYINTSNVLPENPKIISESYGSLWPDSVIMTPKDGTDLSVIFGVDTCAKKIWMFDGASLLIISDYKVQEFLNLNLTLSERENTPIIGIRNVKTVYNAFKHDVMFTFYDDLVGHEEKVWNLCYNTLLKKFITFYSWVPSYMENINNIPFSFDRNVSKWIAKLGQSHSDNSFALGIVLSNNIYNNDGTTEIGNTFKYKYVTNKGVYAIKNQPCPTEDGLIGVFNLLDHVLPEGDRIQYYIKYELVRDIYGYYNNFKIQELKNTQVAPAPDAAYKKSIPIYGLFFNPNADNQVYSDSNKKTFDSSGENVYTQFSKNKRLYFSELYYRNKAGHNYNDYDDYKVTIESIDSEHCTIEKADKNNFPASIQKYAVLENGLWVIKLNEENYFNVVHALDLPVFRSRNGAKPTLPKPMYKENIIQMLNVRATIYARYLAEDNAMPLGEFMNYMKATDNGKKSELDTKDGWFSAGTYESSIAITSKWNLLFLDSSFWKHGQAGVIDKAEDIYPTKWYGEQHPFEFEVVVVNDPSMHKIFLNLEIISNKVKPESFHFEVIGDSYDFAKDKPNMYFRQEARKALLQYNGCSISYDKNFTKINPRLLPKSAELVHQYYERQDTLEDVYDRYKLKEDTEKVWIYPYYEYWASLVPNKDYRHLSGAEITYYPNRQEYRVWQHLPAIDVDDLPQDSASSIIRANCQYLEDRWKVSINPLLICYKNEYIRGKDGVLFRPENSTWPFAMDSSGNPSKTRIPPITIKNTVLPSRIMKDITKRDGDIYYPNEATGSGRDNSLYGLYSWEGRCPIDNTNWLNDLNIYKMNFGEALNRKEADIRDKFVKVRIRYSGTELAVIDFLNTIYTISYA